MRRRLLQVVADTSAGALCTPQLGVEHSVSPTPTDEGQAAQHALTAEPDPLQHPLPGQGAIGQGDGELGGVAADRAILLPAAPAGTWVTEARPLERLAG
jgi:hypothetical protein